MMGISVWKLMGRADQCLPQCWKGSPGQSARKLQGPDFKGSTASGRVAMDHGLAVFPPPWSLSIDHGLVRLSQSSLGITLSSWFNSQGVGPWTLHSNEGDNAIRANVSGSCRLG